MGAIAREESRIALITLCLLLSILKVNYDIVMGTDIVFIYNMVATDSYKESTLVELGKWFYFRQV